MDRSHILLVKPGSLGDVVHALPVVQAIREQRPEAHVSWILDSRWMPLLGSSPLADTWLEFPRQQFRGVAGWARAIGWFGGLGSIRPDLALDLQGLLRSGLMARSSRAARIIGLSDAREGARLFAHALADVSDRIHAVDRYIAALPIIGLEIPAQPEFPLPEGKRPEGLPERFVALHPYSRGAGKSLTPDAIRTFCQAMAPVPVVVCGIGSSPPNLPANVIDRTNGTSLPELLGLLRAAAAVVSVDSGPMHLAAALGRPLASIHTWSDPRKVGPYSERAWVWQGGELRPQLLGREAPLLAETAFTNADAVTLADWAVGATQ